MKDFGNLKVWGKAHELALRVYRDTTGFPREETYGLMSQIRRAAASIPANIAEGCGRGGDGEFSRFVQIAMGSASELEYHLLLAKDLRFLDEHRFRSLEENVLEVKKMLASLIWKLNADRRTLKADHEKLNADRRVLNAGRGKLTAEC